MRVRGSTILGVGILTGGLLLGGCTSSNGNEDDLTWTVPNPQSGDVTQSEDAQTQPMRTWSREGIPFDLLSPHDPWMGTAALHAADAADSAPFTIAPTGLTAAGKGRLPGPSVRVILSSTTALAGLLEPELGVEITDLSQVPTTLGTLDPKGVFTPEPDLAEGPVELPGSNPENLYFEPQDFSVASEWVAWREGSAGEKGALPTLDFDDWRIVAWNPTVGQPREYASAYLLHGQRQAPRISWSGAPTIGGRFIYFAAALPSALIPESEGGDTSEWVTSIIRVPLDNPGAVEVVAVGTAPAADPGGGVFWVQNGTALVHSAEADPPLTEPLFQVGTAGWTIASLNTTDTHVFAVLVSETSANAWIIVWDTQDGRVVAALESVADWVELSVSDNLVTWGNGTANSDPSMYLWRIGGETVTNLGATQGFSVPKVGDGLLAVPRFTDSGAIIWELAEVD